jgi:hypothetical protein
MSTTNDNDEKDYKTGHDSKEYIAEIVAHENEEREQDTRPQEASAANLVSDIPPSTAMNDTTATKDTEGGEEDKYLSGWSLVVVTIGFLLGDFVATLDQSMVATALPKLSSQFNALDHLTWVVSAFFCEYRILVAGGSSMSDELISSLLVAEAGTILTFGQILTIVPTKWAFVFSFVLFMISSLICALAPKLEVLIFGRALQGTVFL